MDKFVVMLDRPRIFKYSIGALKKITGALNCKVAEIDPANFDTDQMVMFIHAGLCHEDKSLTIQQTEELVDAADSLGDILEVAYKAFGFGLGGKKALKRAEEKEAEIEANFRNEGKLSI